MIFNEAKALETLANIATSLNDIARQLGRLNNSASLITSLDSEIVLDIQSRRTAERASYLAYHRAYAEADEKITAALGRSLPEEQPA
jgi:hypothetical protein